MKKILSLSILLCLFVFANAQNPSPNSNANTQWKINGNNASTTDFMGTTNNQSLVFKTNNIQRAEFDTQGRLVIDGGGEVIIHPGGLNRPILSNPIAAYMLKIGGSAHIDGEVNTKQLFVQEHITYLKSLKGPRIDVDTIRMDSTRGIFGNTKIFGDVQIKQNLEVLGDATFKNNLTAEKGILFDNVNGISYSIINDVKLFTYGRLIGETRPLTQPCAAGPQPWANHQFGGMLQIYDADATGNYKPNSGLLNFQTWSGGSSIDASIGGQTGPGGLLLNYFCGNSTFINTGWDLSPATFKNGGRVVMGAEVVMQRSLRIGWNGEADLVDPNTSIEINQSTPNTNGVKVKTWEPSIKAFAVEVPSGINTFVVRGDGRTYINGGVASTKYFSINDPSTQDVERFTILGNGRTDIKATTKIDKYFVINDVSTAGSPVESFVVWGDGRTAIGDSYVPTGYHLAVKGKVLAEEVVVQLRTAWPDYVFNKDYKLKPLSEVEKYISKNNHLENIPSAKEIDANGVTLGNVVSKQMEKIEELTLYLIEQQKQIEELKKQIESIKK